MKPRRSEHDEREEGGSFWGKRNERRRLTGDIDRSDHQATFGKNAPPNRPIGRYFSMPPLSLPLRQTASRLSLTFVQDRHFLSRLKESLYENT